MPASLIVPSSSDSTFDEEGHCLDPAVEQRIRSVATSLLDYIEAHICPRIALEAMVRAGAV